MKKLSKELVKRLIREEMKAQEPVGYVSVRGDDKGLLTQDDIDAIVKKDPTLDKEEDIKINPIDESSGPLTFEAIDRIIRQEVKSHFGA